MSMKQIFSFLALSLLGIASINAQNTNSGGYFPGSVIKIMPDGKDSIFQNVKILVVDDKVKRQQKVVYMDENEQVVELTPYEARGYHSKQTHSYISIDIKKADGTVERVFAQHKFSGNNELPHLYKVYDSQKSYNMYIGQDGDTMQLVSNPDDSSYGNKLTDKLQALNQQYGGNEDIGRYINSAKPTRFSISERYELIKSQNPNKIPHARWGVGTGINLNSLTLCCKDLNRGTGTQSQWSAHIFGEYRTRFGVGLYSELSFLKASCKQEGYNVHTIWENMTYFTTYNRTSLTLPILIRYTLVQLKGKWLPFAEAGLQFRFDIKDKCDDIRVNEDKSELESSYTHDKYENKGTKMALVGGLGVEYRLTKKNSLIFDARYCKEMYSEAYRHDFDMITNTLMFNLSFSF